MDGERLWAFLRIGVEEMLMESLFEMENRDDVTDV